ncbi:receptor-type tyrosine-protein phosphatase U-like [Stegostoma tigrinum]|uniref:receptor-type tyrosine-protein phosphatase U-like n=1 Tax=Stegostoma tigrinum TaxID=3053191 RepID=UPI0028705ED4|nr:receptor-type tyrosine-protein phosphatase U-like [Stegostoma tigrinum]
MGQFYFVLLTAISFIRIRSQTYFEMCTFGEDNACDYFQGTDDDFDWQHVEIQNPSGQTSDLLQGSYMMVNSSKHIQGQKAQLMLPPFTEYCAHCIQFSYFLYDRDGFRPISLNIFIRANNGSLGNSVWNMSESHGKQWFQAEVAVNIRNPNNYQVIFEAAILTEQRGYIALDDILIANSSCTKTAYFQLLEDAETNSGQDAAFHCIVHGQINKAQSLSMQRQHGGLTGPPAHLRYLGPKSFVAIFQLHKLTKQNQDLYRCVIQSGNGSGVSNFAALIVKEPPTPAAAPRVIEVGSTFLMVDLNINNTIGNGPIIQKEMVYQKISDSQVEVQAVVGPNYKLIDLDPDTKYQINIRLTRPGEGGQGKPGPKLISKTKCAEPVRAPKDITFSGIKSRQATVRWDPLGYNSTLCQTYFYTVCYHYTFRGGYIQTFKECQIVTQDTSSFIIRNLQPYTNVYAKITVHNSEGRRESEELNFQTDEDVPGRIPASSIRSSSTEDTAFLEWNEPQETNGVITQYEVSYQCTKSSDPAVIVPCPKKTLLKPRTETNHKFKNLEPGTTYRFSIRASTVKGFGLRVFSMITTNIKAPSFEYDGMPSPLAVTNTTITVQLKPARGRGAPISVYHIIVKEDKLRKVKQEPRTQECFPLSITWEVAVAEGIPHYYSAELIPRSLTRPRPFTVGDNNIYSGYLNAPLESMKNYSIYLQAMSNFNGEKKTNCTLIAEKAAYKGRQVAAPHFHGMGLILGICVGSLALFVLILLYVKKGKCTQTAKTFASSQCEETHRRNVMETSSTDQGTLRETLNSSSHEQHSTMSISSSLSENFSQRPCHRAGFPYQIQELHPAIRLVDLKEHINQMKSSKDYGFKQEYESFFERKSSCHKMSKKKVRRSESRYVNITVYDCRQTKLPPYLEDPGFIYLNLSYFIAHHKAKQFIAAQGPKREMMYDFWRMVWQEHCKCIVMITKLVEVGQVNCCKYWPDDKELYGDISVTFIKAEFRAEYTVRIFSLQKTGYAARREIQQFHFTAWPEHGVPCHATGLLAFIRRVKAANSSESGPLVIHCSTGTGRTGCYIVLDMMMDMATYEGVIDVYNCVKTLSSWHINMIQTEEQYVFIHNAILEAHLCGDTSISVEKFKSTYEEMIRVNPQSNSSKLNEEFQVLNSVTSQLDNEDSSISPLPQNQANNCNMDTVPPDECLPLLITVDDESNKYTNATLLDSYCQAKAFVVIPHPFQNDAADFWRLVYNCNCSLIIMLNQLDELNSARPSLQYWPMNGVWQYGPIQVKFVSCTMNEEICDTLFEVRSVSKLEEKYLRVKHFQYLQWPTNSGVPKCKKSFLNLLRKIEQWQTKCGDGRIVIHRLNGGGQSGILCASISIMEMIKYQKMVDVFHAVQTLRNNQPNMVDCLKQYRFCYDIALDYLEF